MHQTEHATAGIGRRGFAHEPDLCLTAQHAIHGVLAQFTRMQRSATSDDPA